VRRVTDTSLGLVAYELPALALELSFRTGEIEPAYAANRGAHSARLQPSIA
jgi:hypothetical protein